MAAFTSVAVASCGNAPENSPGDMAAPADQGGAPVALAPKREASSSVAMPLNAEEVAKAVERYRITKKKSESPYEQAGADLNGDGRAEALVLFTGPDWCSPSGCTLAVFQPGEFGLRPVSQTIGVKAPVAAGQGSNAGWRDLVVKTGAAKIVRLQFTGGGYPVNAVGQPEAASDVPQVEVLIQPQGPAGATAANQIKPTQ